MNRIKISIIIPIYNAEKYIRRCIDSILSQTFQDFEIILVNDGSKDGSLEICNEYVKSDERIKVINKANGGSASAKNEGLSIVRGEYIEFIDADDYLDKEYISNLMIGYSKYDVDVCIGNVAFTKIGNGAIKSRTTVNMKCGYFTLKEFLAFYPIYMPKAIIGAPWNKLYKREIIEKFNIKFNCSIKNNEDTHFNYNYLSKCSSVYVSDNPYYNYMDENVNSLSRGRINNMFDIYLLTYNKAIQFLKETDTYEINIDFQRKYFINLIIGALNRISTDSDIKRKKKIDEIRKIVYNKDVMEAAKKIHYTEYKKKIMLALVKRKYCRLIYLFLFLNKVLKER